MKKSLLLLLFISGLAPPGPGYSQNSPVPASGTGAVLSDPQWKAVTAQFEDSVMDLSKGLENEQDDLNSLKNEIDLLENKITELRQNSEKSSNVFDEIRLKGLLNDLKDDLEKSSDLQHLQDDKEKEFEQKALSLTALYNDRIEEELQSGGTSSDPSALQLRLDSLGLLIEKRNRVQTLIKKYQKKTSDTEPLPIESLDLLKTNDREGLQLTLDLIRDRKKDLGEKLEKWSIEQDEVKNELKLQGKMQEFLDGIRRMNEDSDFPSGNLKKNNLGNATNGKQRDKLEAHLNELQESIEHGQASMSEMNQLMIKVQNQLETLGGGKSK
jgi:prefoldin subunit 5